MKLRCVVCNCWIETEYGYVSPSVHQGSLGTPEDPRSPGDYDEICDRCYYGASPEDRKRIIQKIMNQREEVIGE